MVSGVLPLTALFGDIGAMETIGVLLLTTLLNALGDIVSEIIDMLPPTALLVTVVVAMEMGVSVISTVLMSIPEEVKACEID